MKINELLFESSYALWQFRDDPSMSTLIKYLLSHKLLHNEDHLDLISVNFKDLENHVLKYGTNFYNSLIIIIGDTGVVAVDAVYDWYIVKFSNTSNVINYKFQEDNDDNLVSQFWSNLQFFIGKFNKFYKIYNNTDGHISPASKAKWVRVSKRANLPDGEIQSKLYSSMERYRKNIKTIRNRLSHIYSGLKTEIISRLKKQERDGEITESELDQSLNLLDDKWKLARCLDNLAIAYFRKFVLPAGVLFEPPSKLDDLFSYAVNYILVEIFLTVQNEN